MLGIVTLVIAAVYAQALPTDVDLANVQNVSPTNFNMIRRIARDGYFSEKYDVITSDGYILEINRIPYSRFQIRPSGPRPVVFLMHGLQSSALSFITLGSRHALAYVLADAGYDVWLGNSRGVLNSRRHIRLNPDDPKDYLEFFDYTYEDIGLKDLPAMIDCILRVTNQEQLNYIGHSQGGTVFFALNSLKPEYNKKFKSVHLLAGAGYKEHFPSNILSRIAQQTNLLLAFARQQGTMEILGPRTNNVFGCSEQNPIYEACALATVQDYMGDLIRSLETIAGASLKQYAHYGQNVKTKKFSRWDFGLLGNLLRYGSFTAPEFDLSVIDVDITLHYALDDFLVAEEDVLNMAEVLPKAEVRKVSRESFTHFDFVTSKDSKELVTDYIVEQLNKNNKL